MTMITKMMTTVTAITIMMVINLIVKTKKPRIKSHFEGRDVMTHCLVKAIGDR